MLLSDLGEFGLIARLTTGGAMRPDVIAGPGDDAAVLACAPGYELLATCDTKGSAPGQFNGPMGIAVDSHDNVYVADTRNDRIQKLVIGPRERASRNDLQHLRNLLSVTVPPVMSQFPPL